MFVLLIPLAFAGINDPTCFGNASTRTACIGGSQGIVNATGTISAYNFLGFLNWSWIQNVPELGANYTPQINALNDL
jgi:hypothetical protein